MCHDWSASTLALFDEAAPAVLTTYRRDGSAAVSPVWFRLHHDRLEVVIGEGDVKLRHLERDPRCSLTVFETTPPFRGARIEGTASLSSDVDNAARAAISTRYLGTDRGVRFVALRSKPGVVLHVVETAIEEWDLSAILPG